MVEPVVASCETAYMYSTVCMYLSLSVNHHTINHHKLQNCKLIKL